MWNIIIRQLLKLYEVHLKLVMKDFLFYNKVINPNCVYNLINVLQIKQYNVNVGEK